MGVRNLSHKGRYSRTTMQGWTKEELIDYIEILEDNERTMAETLQQQARNFEIMLNNLKDYKNPLDGILGDKRHGKGL